MYVIKQTGCNLCFSEPLRRPRDGPRAADGQERRLAQHRALHLRDAPLARHLRLQRHQEGTTNIQIVHSLRFYEFLTFRGVTIPALDSNFCLLEESKSDSDSSKKGIRYEAL